VYVHFLLPPTPEALPMLKRRDMKKAKRIFNGSGAETAVNFGEHQYRQCIVSSR
jgi:hypothetical protein